MVRWLASSCCGIPQEILDAKFGISSKLLDKMKFDDQEIGKEL
jgi:hypothetical protein